MSSVNGNVILIRLLMALAIFCPTLAQTVREVDDGSVLRQIIIFGRHGIRAPASDPSAYSANPYPVFGVPYGYLTPHGQEAARLMGAYFREYLTHEGLLTGKDSIDLSRSYFRANSIQRSNVTASMFGAGLIPGATIPVHSYRIADPTTGVAAVPDPVFDPILAGVAAADPVRALAEVEGIYGTGEAIASSLSGEISLIRSTLAPPGTVDPTTMPITLTLVNPIPATGFSVDPGGLSDLNAATDPFIMEYADGMAPEDVAWGRLTPDAISQMTRVTALQLALEMRPPYICRVQSSNAASHVLRTMNQVVSNSVFGMRDLPGAFGNGKSKILVIISSDYYVTGLAGILGLHWTLPSYQPDFVPPGGALVFELRQSKKTGCHFVRVFFTVQKLDQLRNLTPLTLDVPPGTQQLTIPGCENPAPGMPFPWFSNPPGNLDVSFAAFQNRLNQAIDPKCVQPFCQDDPPPVIENVPLD